MSERPTVVCMESVIDASPAKANLVRWIAAAGVCAAALVFLLPASANAHGLVPFGTPDVIHACRGSRLGNLRQIVSGGCFGTETADALEHRGPGWSGRGRPARRGSLDRKVPPVRRGPRVRPDLQARAGPGPRARASTM